MTYHDRCEYVLNPTALVGKLERCPKRATQAREGELLCDEHAAQWDEEYAEEE
jgi:hypothetical protein